MLDRYPRLFAFLFMALFAGLIWLYVREFPHFGNSINMRRLVWGSIAVVLSFSAGLLWFWRERLTPADRHLPEITFLLLIPPLFAPLAGSLLNRTFAPETEISFTFLSEKPFVATPYGLIKTDQVEATGYELIVRDAAGEEHRFRYKKQAYFPLTKPGESILLPFRDGHLGTQVLEIE